MDLTDRRRYPNLLLIMSDDQGPWALGCAGTPELVTPHLDQLAAEGTRFDHCFCASPVCSPARASWLTGRMPSTHGIHDWLKSGNIDVAAGVTWAGADQPVRYLAGLTGFTQVLADAGYHCGLSGKWHLGDSASPQQGHSFWCAHALGGGQYTNYHVFDNTPDLQPRSQYVTDFFTDRALEFLGQQQAATRPFCLSVHYTAPHAPWVQAEQPGDIWQLYQDCDFPSVPFLPPHPWQGWKFTADQRLTTLQGYCTTITAMDRAIGRLLGRLTDLGLSQDTLVVFTSDNGFNIGHHGVLGKGNGTFPLNMFEESVRVPFIARWPGRVPAGRIHSGLISHYDFMPTVLDLLSLADPDRSARPGRSFAPALTGAPGGAEAVVVADEYGPVRMVRERQWKYVHRYAYGPHELYDLDNDPGEIANRVDDPACARVLADLRYRLEQWFLTYADPGLDGVRQPVNGQGQIGPLGAAGQGRPAFSA